MGCLRQSTDLHAHVRKATAINCASPRAVNAPVDVHAMAPRKAKRAQIFSLLRSKIAGAPKKRQQKPHRRCLLGSPVHAHFKNSYPEANYALNQDCAHVHTVLTIRAFSGWGGGGFPTGQPISCRHCFPWILVRLRVLWRQRVKLLRMQTGRS